MENKGHIRLHRKIRENPIYKKPSICHLFEYCVLEASYKNEKVAWCGNKIEEIAVEKGSFITSTRKMSKETGLSVQTVRTALKTLYSLGMLRKSVSKSTTKYSYITVCNYRIYQSNLKDTPDTNHEGNLEANKDNISDGTIATICNHKEYRNQFRYSKAGGNQQGSSEGNKEGSSEGSFGGSSNHNKVLKENKEANKINNNIFKKKEIKKEKSEDKKFSTFLESIIRLYNEKLPQLPRVIKLTQARRQALKARINEDKDYEELFFWENFFNSINDMDFLNGENNRNWKANFDWIIKSGNFCKILEGTYYTKPKSKDLWELVDYYPRIKENEKQEAFEILDKSIISNRKLREIRIELKKYIIFCHEKNIINPVDAKTWFENWEESKTNGG